MLKSRLAPPDLKEFTQALPIKTLGVPSEVALPLLQHTGKPGQPKVAVGSRVKTGTLIAEAQDYISAPIHASICGTVKSIETRPHPVLGEELAIVIASDGQDGLDETIRERKDLVSLSPDEIRKIIRACGVVGLGGAAFPTQVKLNPPKDKPVDSFILNGAECEPYLSADHRLMLEKAKEIILGMKTAMRVLNVKNGFVAIEENKPDAIELFSNLLQPEDIKVVPLKSFYPQGAEKQLIKTVLKREVAPGKLPFDVGVVVNNVATAFAIYEAVYKNKPLYERVITVGGSIVKHPANLLVRIGTKVKDILDFCGGLTEEPGKVVLGGPMMGISQYTLEVPVIKGTSGIIVFSKAELKSFRSRPCIRCGRCLQVCPLGLNPSALARAIEKGRFDYAREYHVLDCIECGICSYVCPGKSNIISLVKLAKQRLKTPIS
ncbi:MAG: electron transport complex subunit RsxC, partial [Candidatus Omnitrophica bacterium]|nr:electron transport complex subunit RsxC [Candidatus Omnitrophota bacterium]